MACERLVAGDQSVGDPCCKPKLDLVMTDVVIEQVEETKLLGVTLRL